MSLDPSPNATQPAAVPNLSIAEAAPTRPFRRKSDSFRRFKYVIRAVTSGISDLLLLLWIGLVYVIPAGVSITILVGLSLCISFGFAAANGAIVMLTGNGVLRIHHAYYTNNASAAAIGATGSILASMVVGIFTGCFNFDENHPITRFIIIPLVTVLVSALTGTIGCAILLSKHVDLGGIDVLHATRAGALGGTILGVAAPVIMPVAVAIVFGILLSPLLAAMAMGFRWVHVRSSESWNGRTYRSSYCYTYGTCGDDPEIEEELAQIPRSRHF